MNNTIFSLIFLFFNILNLLNGEDIDNKSLQLTDLSLPNMEGESTNSLIDGFSVNDGIEDENRGKMSFGVTSVGESSIGGPGIDGSSIGGTSIGGTSVGGTSVGGTSVGGTSVSGASAGGSDLEETSQGFGKDASIDFEDGDYEEISGFEPSADGQRKDSTSVQDSSSNLSFGGNQEEDAISDDSGFTGKNQDDEPNISNVNGASSNENQDDRKDRAVTYGFGGGPVAPPASTTTLPPAAAQSTDTAQTTDTTLTTDTTQTTVVTTPPTTATSPPTTATSTQQTTMPSTVSTELTTTTAVATTKSSVDPGVVAGAVVGGIAGLGLLGGLGYGIKKKRTRGGDLTGGNIGMRNLRGTEGTFKPTDLTDGVQGQIQPCAGLGHGQRGPQKVSESQFVITGGVGGGSGGDSQLPEYAVRGTESYNEGFSYFED